MKRIFQFVILVAALISCSRHQTTSVNNGEFLFVKDGFSEQTYRIEKVALQLWYLIKMGNLEGAKTLLQNPSNLNELFDKIDEPLNYEWKVVRSVDNEVRPVIDMFVSRPQYYGDPERKPFMQIHCIVSLNEQVNKFERIMVFQNEKIDLKKFNSKGISPNHLPLNQMYLIKNRTLRTVIDSLMKEENEEDFFIISGKILEKLEENDSIKKSDIHRIIGNYTFSDNTYYPIKIFGDYYNQHYLESHAIYDRYLENSNYYLREAILKSIDDYMKMDVSSEPYFFVSRGFCASKNREYDMEEALKIAEENIGEAKSTEAIRILLNTEFSDEIKDELEIFCGAYNWIESRHDAVKRGEEDYSKLESLNTIMIRRMLDIMYD